MNIEQKIQKWKNSDLPSDLKDQLDKMSPEELHDAFYTNLEFGTAGIRGVLGPGSNRLNIYVVRKATVGFAKYLLSIDEEAKSKGVVISHDNRLYSRQFTLEIAKVFSSYGIKSYIFEDLRPTPELSYAVRKLNASGGVMITASHNPKEYNGYKVYDSEGCQLTPNKIKPLVEIISNLPDEIDITYGEVNQPGEIITLDQQIDEDYVNDVLSIQLNPNLNKSNLKIVYSPQHGTGLERAKDIFDLLGYNVTYVKEQCVHDPLFSNTKSPNPEMPEAFELSLEYAKKVDADLIINTDPDADRLGIVFKDRNGKYQLYTGNQTGALLINYVLSQRKEKGLLKDNSVIFNTVVTSSIGQRTAELYGVGCESLLSGFKFIGDKIHQYELTNEKQFEFGYEESYGYLIAPFVRDKDSLQAIVMVCEMVNYYLIKEGKTLDVVLKEIMEKIGYYDDRTYSMFFEGEDGKKKMDSLIDFLRNKPIKELLNKKVIRCEDFMEQKSIDFDGKISNFNHLPKTNLIKFYLEDYSTLAVRPSGTEPKIKFYLSAVGENEKAVDGKADLMYGEIKKYLNI